MNEAAGWIETWLVRGSGWLALALIWFAWVWGQMEKGSGKGGSLVARWLGLMGALAALIHALLSLGTRLEWDLGHLWVQSYLRLGWMAWVWLMFMAVLSLCSERLRKYLPWNSVIRSLLGLWLLMALGHALLAPFSSVHFVLAVAAMVVGLQLFFWIRLLGVRHRRRGGNHAGP